MIIDAHAHLGTCDVFDASQSAPDLLSAMDAADIGLSVVQPFPGAPDAAAVHDLIAQAASDHPGRIVGMASLNPHQPAIGYRQEIARCVKDLGFVAVKLHSIGHAVAPGSSAARLVFRTASDLGVPVMIHTGTGVPFAEPAAWIPLAKEFAETSVVLAHAGGSMFTAPAIVAAQSCPNVFLETSWCNPQDIRRAVAAVGPEKVMFGSDMLFNARPELAKYAAAGFTPDNEPRLFSLTAAAVFGLSAGQ
jgi:predicted TIM-barrel fold metal-dependent hydrolase